MPSIARSRAGRVASLLLSASVFAALAAGTTGCPKRPPKTTPTPEETATPAPTPTPVDDDTLLREGGGTPPGGDMACGDAAVYFELDSSALGADSGEVLKQIVSCLGANAGWRVSVEGHADERGETRYNIALADRRARTVADYLKNAGVDAKRVSAVSYGEEKPADPGHDESAWSKNRRVEFRILK